MREYGQIQCSFWTDPEIKILDDATVRLAAYVLTGPHSNGLGCYYLPFGYVSADFGWTAERVSKGFRNLSETVFLHHCETTEFLLIPKFMHWNPIANGNVAKKRIEEFRAVPKNFKYYNDLVTSIEAFCKHLPEGFLNGIERVSKPSRNKTQPNPTQPKDSLEPETVSKPALFSIPLADHSEYRVTALKISEWTEAFPALDVEQSVREIRQWNIANPKNQKTRSGIERHITAWLTKEQNKAPRAGNGGEGERNYV